MTESDYNLARPLDINHVEIINRSDVSVTKKC